jgi:RHS repeat-associated protein
LTQNEYDELGQLIRKSVGGTDISGQASLQKVDYRYNIRGWLKSINNIKELTQSTDPTDLFAFKITYNQVENTIGGNIEPLFNGNISETFWKTDTDNFKRSYGYQYDALNRLTNAIYKKQDIPTNSYNERLTYDPNGNIITMYRTGYQDGSDESMPIEIDKLVYGYAEKSNTLLSVYDESQSTNGFKDGNINDNDFKYDGYGNMTVDKNKKIDVIKYNHLHLPTEIDFGKSGIISYIYNALGVKVAKQVQAPEIHDQTDYLSGFQYKNDQLQFFPTAEGYVKVTDGGKFNYVYNYTDHLGNIRVSYTLNPADGQLKILEENHYYPFGLKHSNYNVDKADFDKDETGFFVVLKPVERSEFQYKYNGKEYQDELNLNWYDMDARNYMPDIGRWGNMDELAEDFSDLSPYNFSNNNPLRFSDPTGLAPEENIFSNDINDESKKLTSTVVNGKGEIIDHKDDGDDSIYLDSRKGTVIGKEQNDKKYNVGEYLERDDLFANAKLPDGFLLQFNVEPTEFEVSPLIGGITGGLKYIVYMARGGKAVKYVGITSQFAIRQATHLRKKGIFIEKLLENLTKADARAVEQVLIEMYKLPKNGGTLLNKINSISAKYPAHGEALKRGAELLKDVGL